jgi:hypothetical protein
VTPQEVACYVERLSTLPLSLREGRRFVLAKLVPLANGKIDKPPFMARYYKKGAKSNDPTTWATLDECIATLRAHADAFDGIMRVMSHGDGLTGVDYDHCHDAKTGAIDVWAQDFVTTLDSYTEVTVSREGLRTFVLAKIPGDRKRFTPSGVHVEVYEHERFFFLTGEHLSGTPTAVEARQSQLDALYAELVRLDPKDSTQANGHTGHNGHHAPPSSGVDPSISNEDLLCVLRRTDDGKFSALYDRGEWQAYWPDKDGPSEAVGYVVFKLMWAARYDRERVDQMFRASKVFTGKWAAGKWDLRKDKEMDAAEAKLAGDLYDGAIDMTGFSIEDGPSRDGNGDADEPEDDASSEDSEEPGAAWPGVQTAEELLAKDLPPIHWFVKDLIAEGVTVLAGKPKKGKSTLCLNLALDVASGRPALGHFDTTRCEVLYLAIEDKQRRMQKRLRQVLYERKVPKGLYLTYTWNTVDAGGIADLERFLDAHTLVGVVIIDTFTRLRSRVRGRSSYLEDYDALTPLQKLAKARGIAIIVVYHTRKVAAEDPLDEINATMGLAGNADNILVLRNVSGVTELCRQGRDYEDDETYALTGDPVCLRWTFGGAAAEAHRSEERNTILLALDLAKTPLSPKELAAITHQKEGNLYVLLLKLVNTGDVVKVSYGKYGVPGKVYEQAAE